ncbi:MAG: AAA family ATPase [Spirochaetes bacterium]|nr:AAA family ATPase [Spirochaetota bacterium]
MKQTVKRLLDIALPEHQSVFLWGPRKTGKSTYLKMAFPDSIVFDFLRTELVIELSKRPSAIREQLLSRPRRELEKPIILDEVQKIPAVLDEVQELIENHGLRFILCGSSARKLKRGKANLLGGRAWRFELFPFVTAELEEPDLLRILNRGLVPSHYFSENFRKSLSGYVRDYLKEEVFDAGLTRNVPAFSRFFDAMGYSHGELANYANIARECGVDPKTVKEYYTILCDTLLGRLVDPYKKRQERQVITKAAKFYLFDVGVAGAITRRSIAEERGEQFGKAFEHFLFMELAAHASYSGLEYDIHFWRTKSGLEVDFILGTGEVAIEVKGASRVDDRDLRPLRAFTAEHKPRKAIVVCSEKTERVVGDIRVLPWRSFLRELWGGGIIG